MLGITMIVSSMGFQKKKSKETEIQELIDIKVAEKVEAYRIKRLAKCRERILSRAGELADSIIMAAATKSTVIDSVAQPIPPDRPERPEIKRPLDTTPVVPFFPVDSSN